MEFIRLDTKDDGPVYVRPNDIAAITKDGENTAVSILFPNGDGERLIIATDPDEMAMMLERSVPGSRFYRAP